MAAFDRLAISIAVLAALNRVPGSPVTEQLAEETLPEKTDSVRSIAFRHEKIFVQQLAFICAYSDNPLHVSAFCMEEVQQLDGVTIRLAANTGKHQALLDGLRPIATMFEREASQARSVGSACLLKAVIKLNRRRILSRMRSTHSSSHRARQKASLLQRCRTFLKLLSSVNPPSQDQYLLSVRLLELIEQLEQLETMVTRDVQTGQADDLLCASVQHTQSMLFICEETFELVPCNERIWAGGETASLLNRLKKIARYSVACTELLRVVRRYGLFSNIKISFVDIQQCGPMLSQQGLASISQLLVEFLPKDSHRTSASTLQGLPKIKQTISQELQKSSRVHAEIQLAVFYERNVSLLAPRVICSTKSACYLCHLFLELQGKYHVPSTHGRIYEAWRWPSQSVNQPHNAHGPGSRKPEFGNLFEPFRQSVGSKVKELLRRGRIQKVNHPAESLADLLGVMTPSVASIASTRSDDNTSKRSSTSQTSQPSAKVPAIMQSEQQSPSEQQRREMQESAPNKRANSVETSAGNGIAQTIHCVENETLVYRLEDGSRALRLRVPGLDVEISHVLTGCDFTDTTCAFLDLEVTRYNWLEPELSRPEEKANVLDVKQCNLDEEELPYGIALDGGIYIRHKQTVLRLKVMPTSLDTRGGRGSSGCSINGTVARSAEMKAQSAQGIDRVVKTS